MWKWFVLSTRFRCVEVGEDLRVLRVSVVARHWAIDPPEALSRKSSYSLSGLTTIEAPQPYHRRDAIPEATCPHKQPHTTAAIAASNVPERRCGKSKLWRVAVEAQASGSGETRKKLLAERVTAGLFLGRQVMEMLLRHDDTVLLG